MCQRKNNDKEWSSDQPLQRFTLMSSASLEQRQDMKWVHTFSKPGNTHAALENKRTFVKGTTMKGFCCHEEKLQCDTVM